MANHQYAFLNKDDIPDREAWQAAIDESGFDFQLDPELKPFEDSGFLPCTLAGKPAGFEIYYEPREGMPEVFEEYEVACDYCIVFRWGGVMMECASVMVATYALAKYFGAIVAYEGEPPERDMEKFHADTLNVIELGKNEPEGGYQQYGTLQPTIWHKIVRFLTKER